MKTKRTTKQPNLRDYPSRRLRESWVVLFRSSLGLPRPTTPPGTVDELADAIDYGISQLSEAERHLYFAVEGEWLRKFLCQRHHDVQAAQ